MPVLIIIVAVVLIVAIFYSSNKAKKVREEAIQRRKNFVLSFSPNARIIVNDGNYIFFKDDSNQVFGVDESGKTYSYSGLRSINFTQDSFHFYHENTECGGVCLGKSPYPSDTFPSLGIDSVSAISSVMFPILQDNLHKKLASCGITPTHEYVNRGVIWGCDINTKMFYNTFAYFQIHEFHKLLKVTMQDVTENSDWKCSYIITVTIKGEDGWDDDETDIYVDDKTTLNNLMAMFKGIKDRQNCYTTINKQENFDMMDGHEFEYFCAKLLRNNGYQNVEVTQGSGDQGIDIIAYRDGIKYGVQCKCYASDIGNKAVQEVFAGKAFYECHVGVVLTNQHFTKSAIELAQKNGILLWDRSKLLAMIETSKLKQY